MDMEIETKAVYIIQKGLLVVVVVYTVQCNEYNTQFVIVTEIMRLENMKVDLVGA